MLVIVCCWPVGSVTLIHPWLPKHSQELDIVVQLQRCTPLFSLLTEPPLSHSNHPSIPAQQYGVQIRDIHIDWSLTDQNSSAMHEVAPLCKSTLIRGPSSQSC